MEELKERLLNTGMINDNEYLDLYVSLIYNNRFTKSQKNKTQIHHIIPRCYYKLVGQEIDNSDDNLVVLLYKDHVLAHYYLSLCSKGQLHYEMAYAMIFIRNMNQDEVDDDFINSLDKYQELYEENMKLLGEKARDRFTGIKQTEEHIQKRVLKNTGQKRSEETKRRISESQKGRTFTDESRRKMSIAHKKYAASETNEHKALRMQRWKETMENKSDEWKKQHSEKLSKAITGRRIGVHERENKSKAMTGKAKSEQHKIALARASSKYIYYYNDALFQSEKEMLSYLKDNGIDINSYRLKNWINDQDKLSQFYPELVGKIKREINPRYEKRKRMRD